MTPKLDTVVLVYNLWHLFVRVLKNQSGHTEAIKSRYELLLVPAKMIISRGRKIVKLAVSNKFASLPKQAYKRLEHWLSQTAPQLNLTMGKIRHGYYLTPPKPHRQSSHDPLSNCGF